MCRFLGLLSLCSSAAWLSLCVGLGREEPSGSHVEAEFVIWVLKLSLSIYPSIRGSLLPNVVLKSLLYMLSGLTSQ